MVGHARFFSSELTVPNLGALPGRHLQKCAFHNELKRASPLTAPGSKPPPRLSRAGSGSNFLSARRTGWRGVKT
eukprot:3841492-Amphidinium_carterae.1